VHQGSDETVNVQWAGGSNVRGINRRLAMSDKDRQKKDGERPDKKNQRMREAVSNRKDENPTERQRQKHEAKLTDSVPEGEGRMKKKARAG